MQQRDLKKDLTFRHAQHLSRLLLSHGDALNAAPVDHGEVAGVVDNEGDDARRHTGVVEARPDIVVEPLAGTVEDDDKLEHQRRAADDPDERLDRAAQGGADDPDDHVKKPAYRLAAAA